MMIILDVVCGLVVALIVLIAFISYVIYREIDHLGGIPDDLEDWMLKAVFLGILIGLGIFASIIVVLAVAWGFSYTLSYVAGKFGFVIAALITLGVYALVFGVILSFVKFYEDLYY